MDFLIINLHIYDKAIMYEKVSKVVDKNNLSIHSCSHVLHLFAIGKLILEFS